eukprot:gnl/TRDRNA2_/TRDRNA2_76478_c0_seq2.p1 gnl/TRDRNA2_/TRDRNA2_76478_c0~~gnl/TRDRNA2_/TRDRNA2_76478_c0_seq2.p1  ORF type:complete len:276 (+),score=42.70 gnl/TRDRNA2_/TRDRNA2_76478_c0_seq2:2-829(+)
MSILTSTLLFALLCNAISQLDETQGGDSCHLDFPLQPSGSISPELAAGVADTLSDEWKRLLHSDIYKSNRISGYKDLPDEELQELDINSSETICKPSTFGEIDGKTVFEHPEFHLGEGDHFMDLGSGVGKQVIGAALFFNASRSVGIELSEERFRASCRALKVLESLIKSASCGRRCHERVQRPGRIEMRRANILDVDLSNVTAVTVYNTCFPQSVIDELQHKLLLELPLGARVKIEDKNWKKTLVLEGRTLRRVAFLLDKVEMVEPGPLNRPEL